ncbi:MAG: rod shape-determining protein MreC [Burkholderiales bacterium]
MEHSPPPFFKRGPAPVVRLAFFASLSLALLVLDARFHYAEGLRRILAIVAYPLQLVATAPLELGTRVAGYFTSQTALREDNAELRARLLASERDAQRYQAAEAEAERLRRLVGAAEHIQRKSIPAEIVYAGRDPYSLRVIIDKGSQQGVAAGSPVVDDTGVVGQVTRVFPLTAEVTLVTERDHAIPVEVVRTGLRVVAFGGGSSGLLELRFIAPNVEIRNGDLLATSGIDGTYPAGLPVATVSRVERDAAHGFARILCEPAAGVNRGRFVLVLSGERKLPPYPVEATPATEGRRDKSRRPPRKKDQNGAG